jgi:lysophospholipase L1-like esterase
VKCTSELVVQIGGGGRTCVYQAARPRSSSALIVLMALLVAGLINPRISFAETRDSDQPWVTTWGASPMAPLPANTTNPGFSNQTVRLIVHTSIGGDEVRVRLSNAFGTDSLVIGAAHIAIHSKGPEIVQGTDRVLMFSGAGSTTIPPGALVVSDGVRLHAPPLSDLAVTIYLPRLTGQATWHAAAHETNYVSPVGDFSGSAEMPVDHTVTSWFYLTDVEVLASKRTLAIVALGDSITDGTNSTLDANHRWPDFLAARLVAHHTNLAVVDEGIGGNRILHDLAGPNALARLDRDVLTQTGVGYATLLLGINDIGFSVRNQPTQPVSANEIIAGYLQMITRAHERALKIFGCSLTPFEGAAYFTAEGETEREAVNSFIRTSGTFDGVIDFDAAVRDPAHPTRLLPANDSGDHLHPNDTGYQAMANSIDLSLFRRGR